ncbi:hypothetical protein, partial [Pseudomonas savastanoi]
SGNMSFMMGSERMNSVSGGISRNRRKFRRKTSEAWFPAGSSTRHGFTYTFYPWKGAIFSLGAAASEINCLASIRTSTGFPPMTEISGIPAYNP